MDADVAAIEQAVLRLMDELGAEHLGEPLAARGWVFAFDRARRRLGACHHPRSNRSARSLRRADKPAKKITLSHHHAALGGWPLMEDVARHEIAHALDYETRGRSDHGPAWRRWALACGADPSRLYEGELPRDPDAPYHGTCPACGVTVPFYRRPTRKPACKACCAAHNGGRYDPRFRLCVRSRRSAASPAHPR